MRDTSHASLRIATADGTSRTTKPLVSIIISTLDRAATLRNTLSALGYLRYPNFEVIVVNGPSSDTTELVLAEFADQITALHCDVRNLSRSRNIGISNAHGDVVAFIDDDAIPEPDWLDELIKGFEDPEVASVGGFIRNHTGVAFQAKYVVCDLYGKSQSYETLEQADCEESATSPKFFSHTGTNVAIRRSCLKEIGGFDEAFEYFLDETDVNLRLVQKGYKSRIVPEAEIHHKYAPSHLRTKTNIPRNMIPICRSVAYFGVRHAMPRYGWMAVYQSLKAFERSELIYKSQNLAGGDITPQQFSRLVYEIKYGIRDGINKAVHSPPSHDNLSPYRQSTAPRRASSIKKPDERLRMCFLSQDEGAATPGGIAKWTRDVATGLAKRGHEITVIGHSSHSNDTVDFVEGGYWRHLIAPKDLSMWQSISTLGLPPPLANHAKMLSLEIDRIVDRRKFNLVSGPIWDVEPAAMMGARYAPVCLSLHTTAALALDSKPEWRRNSDYFRNHVLKVIAAEKAALLRADWVLANSRAIVRDIERLYGVSEDRRFCIVPHGVEDVPYQLRAGKSRGDSKTINILFVGRLETRKGLNELLPALERLLAENEQVRVNFVGSGSESDVTFLTQQFQSKFSDRVRHRGFVLEEELQRYYSEADIFVAPSRYESFGLIFAEAMRFSIPCVGTIAGGIPEVVAHGDTGLLSPVGDIDALYANLHRLCTDRVYARNLGVNGRRRYEELFTVDAMISGLENFYCGAIDLHAAAPKMSREKRSSEKRRVSKANT